MHYTLYNGSGEHIGNVESSSTPSFSWVAHVVEGKHSSFTKFVGGEVVDTGTAIMDQEKKALVDAQVRQLLTDSDFTQLPDAPYTEEQKEEWKTYRDSLRNLSKRDEYPNLELPRRPE